MSRKKLAGIIAACVIATIVVIVLVIHPPSATPTYTLSVNISPAGAGSVSTLGGEYESDDQVTLTATPASGYTFDHWSGSASDTSPTMSITMNRDYSITANFVAVYDLIISSTAGGSVTTPGEGTFAYDEGTVVNLVATTDAYYHFVSWAGDVGTIDNVNAASTTITMNGDYEIVANFEEEAHQTVLIIVNESIYEQIQENLGVFESDLGNEGYRVEKAVVDSATEPPEIRNIIKSHYDSGNLVGAILVGDIKAPYFESHSGDFSNPDDLVIWIALDATDMYYMDLDGDWEHVVNPDFCEDAPSNVAECHEYSTCEIFSNQYLVYLNEEEEWDYWDIENKNQYEIEIWVSRIMAHNLDIPNKDEPEIINDYLEWNHKFRKGDKDVENKAYILCSGSGYNDQNMDFTEIFQNTIKQENVTKSEYIDCLEDIGGSELMYFTAHSGPQGHNWYDDSLSADELIGLMKNSVFYLLNACSSCRWDQYVTSPSTPNYMGGLYVFDKHVVDGGYGLGVIGFTGVGGFNNLEFFTDYLNSIEEPTYGDAFVFWFNQNLMINFGIHNYVFLGDPTIGPYHGTYQQ
jgi:uncharacterized repeat protein (TIGR02543 family)